MAWYRCGGGGLPAGLQSDMDTVLNKKLGTSTTYPPTDWPDTVNLMGPLPEKTASGAIAHIEDGADGVPLKNWLVTLPSSLDGYTEVNGTKAGKNLISTIQQGGIDGTNGAETSSNTRVRTGFIKVNSSTKYTCAVNSSNTNMVVFQVVEYSSANTSGFISATGKNVASTTFTTSATTKYLRITARDTTSANITPTDLSNWQLEQSETATTFEAFNGTQYTASLGRTIYGGTADIVNGQGTDGSILIDLSELSWNMDNDTRFRSRQTDYTGASGWSGNWQNTVSNRFVCENPSTSFANRSDYSFANIPQNYYNFDIKVPTGIFTNANDFKAWLANIDGNGTHAVVVIDRLTATDFAFTPIDPIPETENGVINFWSDQGDSDVTYRADISLALAQNNGGRGLMMMRLTEPEETEETEETEGLDDELNR